MALYDRDLHDASSRTQKHCRLVAVIFGLLCILQATLNISLRLVLYKNLTEDTDELRRKLSTFDNYSQQGWVYFSHSFYFVSAIDKSWQESREYCVQRGADLVIINSREEQEFTRQFRRQLWIGLTDREMEGTWKWVDGTFLNTSYWHAGEPNSHRSKDEDCGQIKMYEAENSWNDAPCNILNFWICEKIVAL
ncbi:C-type lectin domain family 4 member M-like [Pempheris klunzingeri]|uniref:C-type lectin domain family 4 member M-like n=1 Tax=Pempheris klunzingeri TaxID=3127111 RepID=UPI0039805661